MFVDLLVASYATSWVVAKKGCPSYSLLPDELTYHSIAQHLLHHNSMLLVITHPRLLNIYLHY